MNKLKPIFSFSIFQAYFENLEWRIIGIIYIIKEDITQSAKTNMKNNPQKSQTQKQQTIIENQHQIQDVRLQINFLNTLLILTLERAIKIDNCKDQRFLQQILIVWDHKFLMIQYYTNFFIFQLYNLNFISSLFQ
ncbi:unnamed protein product [Paramecium octaurelia]|uniref:Uncharacterized protein n=1 Tax=Paramecium octaurelia TaxID=43137 RepID=A0A8S1VPK0_PAROT|nr:unnamed protein product [Paramecium octaurelia]